MKHIDEQRLDKDVAYRYEVLADLVDFGPGDVKAIHDAAPRLVPRLPQVVEAIYRKMFEYDVLGRHFVQRHHGYTGPVPGALGELTPDHPQVVHRKQWLRDYFVTMFTAEFDGARADYMSAVGAMHTTKAGNASIQVPLMYMNAMLGHMTDLLFAEILGLGLDPAATERTLRAVNKLLWIQQSFISRQYV